MKFLIIIQPSKQKSVHTTWLIWRGNGIFEALSCKCYFLGYINMQCLLYKFILKWIFRDSFASPTKWTFHELVLIGMWCEATMAHFFLQLLWMPSQNLLLTMWSGHEQKDIWQYASFASSFSLAAAVSHDCDSTPNGWEANFPLQKF